MWTYEGKEIHSHDDLLPGCTDIVYKLEYADGKFYYGKKQVVAMKLRPPLAGKKRKRRVETKLPFAAYQGSHETAAIVPVRKEILYQCSSRKAATFIEAATLFGENGILNEKCINSNVLGKFFVKDIKGLLS